VADQAGSGRLAELTIALSLASDLGTGQPMEHGLRTCWLSLAASAELGLDAATRSCVYYVALLRFVGCTSDASETAVLAGGDEVALNAAMAPMLLAQPGESMRYFVRHLAEDLPLHRRVGRVVGAMADPGMEHRSLSGHCEVAARLAARLGMAEAVCQALAHGYERWDGKGHPAAWRARRCRWQSASSPPPGTPSCGHARPAGRPPPRCSLTGGGTPTTRPWPMPWSPTANAGWARSATTRALGCSRPSRHRC
jgi:hypothetical protein